MGFTPLEGLVMATRSGSVDPGPVLWLLEHERAPERRARRRALEHESGLLGLAGSADMRESCERAGAGRRAARLALDVYLHRLRAAIAAMAAALGGLDALVFTGGVGEHSPAVRAARRRRARLPRRRLDEIAAAAAPDRDVSAAAARVATLVLAAREDREIARQVRAALRAHGQPHSRGLS